MRKGIAMHLETHPPKNTGLSLQRTLNAPLLTLYGLGVTVGAGIYVLVGSTAGQAGAYAPVAFLVAAFVVAFTALSYAELSTRFPVSSGEAAYIEAGFKSGWLATLVGLAVAVSGTVSASAIAIGAASYLHDLTGLAPIILILIVVAVMGLIATWGITQSVIVAAIITVIEILGLLFVIFWSIGVADPQGLAIAQMVPPVLGDHWTGIAAASLLAFFAFVGFEDMANVAEEVKDPTNTMPRAIIWTLVLATLLYVATTVSVLMVVPLDRLTSDTGSLTLVFDGAPLRVKQIFGMVAIVATVNGVLIQMIMASRVLYGLADRGHLPAALAHVSPRTRTPIVATVSIVAIIALLSTTMPIDALAEWTSQIVLVVFVLVNLSLIRLKVAGQLDGDYFQVPIVVPAMGVITSVALFATAFL
jgi:amino acid transporter